MLVKRINVFKFKQTISLLFWSIDEVQLSSSYGNLNQYYLQYILNAACKRLEFFHDQKMAKTKLGTRSWTNYINLLYTENEKLSNCLKLLQLERIEKYRAIIINNNGNFWNPEKSFDPSTALFESYDTNRKRYKAFLQQPNKYIVNKRLNYETKMYLNIGHVKT